MTRLPWKHTSPNVPFCALMIPQGLITWYSPCTRAPFSEPIRDEAVDHGRALQVVLRYKVVRGKLVGPAVDVVKSLDLINGVRMVEVKNLPGKSATADIATDDARHVWPVSYPFYEGDFDAATKCIIVPCEDRGSLARAAEMRNRIKTLSQSRHTSLNTNGFHR